MYVSSIYRPLSYVTSLVSKSRSIHTIAIHENLTNPSGFYSPENLEGTLSSKLAAVVQACACSDHFPVQQGQQIHAQIILNGIDHTGLLGTRILGMYVLCGRFIDAKNMFYGLQLCYASPWNWMIRGFTMMGHSRLALLFYFKMLGFYTWPDKYTFPYVIKACAGLKAVTFGKLMHNTIRQMSFEMDVYVGSALIKLYAENDCLCEARCLFDRLHHKDGVLWNVMLNGYVKHGDSDNAIELFREMRNSEIKPNSITYASILSVCASEAMITYGSQLHGLVIRCGLEMDPPVANTLVAMYAKCRCFSDARGVFDATPLTDSVSWNGMIGGYVQNGFMFEAWDLFCKMVSAGVKLDSITFASFLPSVSELASLCQGKEIHCYIFRHDVPLDVFLKNALIDMYFKCRAVEMAWNVFNHSIAVDVVIVTAMITGYVLNSMHIDAIEMFRWLIIKQMTPNAVTLASTLPASAGLASLKLGMELHGYILKNRFEGRFYVGSAITDMYAKCGRLDLAHLVFMRMSERDAVCWNSMITSCSQNGKPEEAIDLFRQMAEDGMEHDCVSISAALSACGSLPALRYGKEIHGLMVRKSLSSDLFAESALIDMYAKCGNLDLACRVFDMMEEKNEVSWNSIIAAYGNHGRLKDSLALFHEMKRVGFEPDHVTFLAIISACGHGGQVEEGKYFFSSMTKEYGIVARMEHYACMIDLFGRAGRLVEAFDIIKSMPFNPDAGVWGTLLGACRVHGNVQLAEVASRNLTDLDPQNSGYYVLLSNTQADVGEWDGVLKIRSTMQERGVRKVPGCSWIEVTSTAHVFVAADTSHPLSGQIYLLLKNLLLELRKEGYVPQRSTPTHPQNIL